MTGRAVFAGWLTASYSGPPPLTVARAFGTWALDLPVLCLAAGLAALYLAGARRAGSGGTSWPWARVAAFCGGGLGSLVLATMSFLGAYERVLFAARAGQTVLLLLVTPLFLALGRPLTLLAHAVPGTGNRMGAVLGTPVARMLTFPAVTAFALVVTPFVLYFSPWYAASLTGAGAELTRLALLVPGLVFFWTLLRVDPVPKAYPYVVSLWVSGIEVIGDAVLGLAVMADHSLIAGGYYHALARPWGPAPRVDQVVGGGVLWILGDIVGLPFFAAQFIQMMREDARDAAAADAAADWREAAVGRRTPGDQHTGEPDDGKAVPERPWWESDPRFRGRFTPPPPAG